MATAHSLQHAYVPPAVHVATVNPYLTDPLTAATSYVARGGPAPLPMQSCNTPLSFGVSSFGAQGTNAHIIMQVGDRKGTDTADSNAVQPVDSSLQPSSAVVLHTKRHWIAPPTPRLLTRAINLGRRGQGPRVMLEARLDRPGMAWLWDGPTPIDIATRRVLGGPLLSSGTALSAASEALCMLDNSGHGCLMLQSVVLSQPTPLPGRPGTPGHIAPTLHVTCSQQGVVTVKADTQVQLRATVGWCSVQPAAGGQVQPARVGARKLLARLVVRQLQSSRQPAARTALAAQAESTVSQGDGTLDLHPLACEHVMQLSVAASTKAAETLLRPFVSHARAVAVSLQHNTLSEPHALGQTPHYLSAALPSGVAPSADGPSPVLMQAGGVVPGHAPAHMALAAFTDMVIAPEDVSAVHRAAAMTLTSQLSTAAQEAATEPEGLAADHPLLAMGSDERSSFLEVRLACLALHQLQLHRTFLPGQSYTCSGHQPYVQPSMRAIKQRCFLPLFCVCATQAEVLSQVRNLIGRTVDPEEPLIAAGMAMDLIVLISNQPRAGLLLMFSCVCFCLRVPPQVLTLVLRWSSAPPCPPASACLCPLPSSTTTSQSQRLSPLSTQRLTSRWPPRQQRPLVTQHKTMTLVVQCSTVPQQRQQTTVPSPLRCSRHCGPLPTCALSSLLHLVWPTLSQRTSASVRSCSGVTSLFMCWTRTMTWTLSSE